MATRASGIGMAALLLALAAPSVRGEDTWSEPFVGVKYLHRTTTEPKPWDMHIAFLDLTEPSNRLIGTVEEDKGMSTPQWAEKKKVQVAINGSLFGTGQKPISTTVGEGRPWTKVGEGGERGDEFGWFAEGGGRIEYYLPGSDVKPAPWMKTLIIGAAMLLWKGEILPPMSNLPRTKPKDHLVDPLPESERCKMTDLPRMNPRNPRTAIGTTKDGKTMIFFIVDGRQKQSVGMAGMDMQQVFHEFGAWNALNLDGGGSTCMYMEGKGVLNKPSDGKPRHVSNSIGLYAKPGTGRLKGQVKGVVKEKGTGKPLAGAKVAVSSSYFDVTDEKGFFHLSQVPAGQPSLDVTLQGFKPAAAKPKVEASAVCEIVVELEQ